MWEYWLHQWGWVIQVLGVFALGLLTAYGLDWLSAKMSQDLDSYQMLDDFVDLTEQTFSYRRRNDEDLHND